MSISIINKFDWWLSEAEEPTAAQAPQTDPAANIVGQGQNKPVFTPDQSQQQPDQPEDNVEDDPVQPDKDEKSDGISQDFEQWKHDFFELSIKGDVNEMLSAIGQVNDRELESPQRRFVADNLQILLFRQEANIVAATKQIRNTIKEDLDRTNPGTTVMQHITAAIEKDHLLVSNLIKCAGMGGAKGELHRKFLASLLGAVQVGGGSNRQDLMYFDKEYTINFSTRFATQFGEINLGNWSLKSDDAERYLTDPEVDRLSDGSPEEKQTLRRRIMIESIGEKFKERAYLIHIIQPDFTIFNIGWDLGDSLLAAYKEGKIVVRGKQNAEKDAMISDTGEIVTLIDIDILFVNETGETDDNGKPEMVEMPFIERRNSKLYLCADVGTLQSAAASLSGMFFHGTPFNGNPSEGQSIYSCIPSLGEILSKRCGPQ